MPRFADGWAGWKVHRPKRLAQRSATDRKFQRISARHILPELGRSSRSEKRMSRAALLKELLRRRLKQLPPRGKRNDASETRIVEN